MLQLERVIARLRVGSGVLRRHEIVKRCCSSSENSEKVEKSEVEETKLSGFAKSFDLHESIFKNAEEKPLANNSFASLLRNSNFIGVRFFLFGVSWIYMY